MTKATGQIRRPWLIRVTPQMVVLFLIAAGAASWTIIRADGMWDEPGTMGYGLVGFMGMWALMMAAMMFPSVAPFASIYSRTVKHRRLPRLGLFAGGYLAVWAFMGIPAFGLALLADRYAGGAAGTAIAATVFAAAGLYQLSPIKDRCLAHCRTPLGHLLHYAAFRGPARDARAGFEHGLFCAACCWGLMAVLVAVGVMNVPAMVVLAGAIALEKVWTRGQLVSRGIGAAALAAAVAVIWIPGLAPGLTSEPMHDHQAAMDTSMGVGGDATSTSMDASGDDDGQTGAMDGDMK